MSDDTNHWELYKEALSVLNETGQTPRQLKEDLERAIELLKEARTMDLIDSFDKEIDSFLTSIENKKIK